MFTHSLCSDNEIWICKPTGRNQGKGIFLVRTIDDLNQSGGDNEEASQQNQQQGKPQKPLNRIIQRLLRDLLLLLLLYFGYYILNNII